MTAARRLDERVLAGVAHSGKPAQSVEVRAGPIDPVELETWSDEKIEARLRELEAESQEGG